MLPAYYNELYVAVCASNGRIIGAGLYYNEDGLIITCAHVVNSALGRAQNETSNPVGQEIQIRFSQATVIPSRQYYKAEIAYWCPDELQAGEAFSARTDIAVLKLVSKETYDLPVLLDLINPIANDLRFVIDDRPDNIFYCVFHHVGPGNEEPVPVNGVIQQYIPSEGKTTLSGSDNIHDAMLKPGASGSPIFSATLNGISGIADQLVDNKAEQIRYAFMIDARRLEQVLPDSILVHKPSLKKKTRTENKFRCDRQKVIDGILSEKSKTDRKGNLFFLWGDEEQEGKAFSNRYELEFIRAKDASNSSISIQVDLPADISNLGYFQTTFLDTLISAAANSNKRLVLGPDDDILKAGLALRHVRNKLFLFKIIDFNSAQAPCYTWFFQNFLKAGQQAYPEDLHVLVLFEFGEYDPESATKRSELFKLFGNPTSFVLEDVTKPQISRWISQFGEADDSPFILKLKELTSRTENELPMLAIYEQFDDALRELSSHERI